MPTLLVMELIVIKEAMHTHLIGKVMLGMQEM
jgi:hypothetical protein